MLSGDSAPGLLCSGVSHWSQVSHWAGRLAPAKLGEAACLDKTRMEAKREHKITYLTIRLQSSFLQ